MNLIAKSKLISLNKRWMLVAYDFTHTSQVGFLTSRYLMLFRFNDLAQVIVVYVHRFMSAGCMIIFFCCRLTPENHSVLVITGSQVTLVSGNRSSWKYSVFKDEKNRVHDPNS